MPQRPSASFRSQARCASKPSREASKDGSLAGGTLASIQPRTSARKAVSAGE